jgi:hypothetical protein
MDSATLRKKFLAMTTNVPQTAQREPGKILLRPNQSGCTIGQLTSIEAPMRRSSAWLVAALLCGLAAPAIAQTQDAPPLETKPKAKSRTWTNEDLEKLSGPVNVLGTKDAPAAKDTDPFTPKKPKKEEEKCESDAWVAAVTTVLREQGILYEPRYWSGRLFGDACLANVGIGAVAARIDGDYTLDDGTKLHAATTVTSGLPPAPQIVSSIDERRPLIVKWKSQPLIMTKVDYLDRQYNYVSVYAISGLMLTNALTGRVLLFDMKTNNQKEIDGTLQVKVSKRQ